VISSIARQLAAVIDVSWGSRGLGGSLIFVTSLRGCARAIVELQAREIAAVNHPAPTWARFLHHALSEL
jgi:hypothetical protein